jgi:hypothetical protein
LGSSGDTVSSLVYYVLTIMLVLGLQYDNLKLRSRFVKVALELSSDTSCVFRSTRSCRRAPIWYGIWNMVSWLRCIPKYFSL